MTPDEYQKRAEATALYQQSVHNVVSDNHLGDFERLLRLSYCTTKLAGEAGEVAEKVGKLIRDYGGSVTPEFKADIMLELGDVLWYVANLAHEMGGDLNSVMKLNIDKLEDRQKRDKLKGSGDYR